MSERYFRIYIISIVQPRAIMRRTFAYTRAYACRMVLYARVHATIMQYWQVMRSARPILIPFIALLLPPHSPHISIFSPSLWRSDGERRRTETTLPARKQRNRKTQRRRDKSWEITKSLAISRRRLSRVGKAENVENLRFLENVPPQFSLFPS